MRKLILSVAMILSLGLFTIGYAQQQQQSNVPHAIKYQAVARDSKGDVISNQNVSFRISIVEGTETGTAVYQEIQSVITNQFGLANLAIGKGNVVSGNFNDIQWGEDSYFVKVEFDPQGGTNYALMGISQMLSVPYAMYAERTNFPTKAALVATNVATPFQNPETGMLVYNTGTSGTGQYEVIPGYYYNAGTPALPNWVPISARGTNSNPDRTLLGPLTSSGTNTTFGGQPQNGQIAGCLSGNETSTSCPTGTNNTGFGTGTFGGNASTNPTNNNNTAVGYNSMNNITSGSNNTGVGEVSLVTLTTGSDDVAVGLAQAWLTTGARNTAIGNYALDDQQTGSSNTAVGYAALDGPATFWSGNQNTAVGDSALASNTGSKNVAVGYAAEAAVTSGLHNTAVGYEALTTITTGSSNTAVGYEALFKNTGIRNTAVGDSALWTNTTGKANNALGYGALQVNTTGNQNEAIGNGVLVSNTTGSANTACGHSTLDDNTTGFYNTALGYNALNFSTTASSNTALGANSLENMGNGTGVSDYNTAVGDSALYNNTTGLNTGTGYGVLVKTTSGTHNTGNGYEAGENITTASSNTAVGYVALNLPTGDANTAIGDSALYGTGGATDNGVRNTGTGYQALLGISTGSCNTATGVKCLLNTAGGSFNTAVGDSALITNTTGKNNSGLGYKADVGSSGLSYATAIGSGAKVSGSNSMALGGNNTTSFTFVGIGQSMPIADLDIADAGTSGSSSTNDHIKSEGFIPNVATSYACTVTMTTNSTDVVGNVGVTSGTFVGTGTITVTFNKSYNIAPIVVLTPANCDAAKLAPYVFVTSTVTPTSTFVINICNGGITTGLAPSWNYMVIEPN